MITLATLKEATEQEVFDQVVNHLRKQGIKSARFEDAGNEPLEFCMYRSPEGYKCAAGCLIADNEYSATMEGNTWDDLIETHGVTDRHCHLIRELQHVHDACGVEYWEKAFERTAERFGLTYTPLKEQQL